MISHEKDNWVVDEIHGVKDTRKRNQIKAKVNLELIKDEHEEQSEDITGNFRLSPLVEVDGRKLGRFLCTWCKSVSFGSFSNSVTELLIHNLHRHEVDDLKCSPKAKLSMITTSINIYVNMNDTDVKKKFKILDSKDKKKENLFYLTDKNHLF